MLPNDPSRGGSQHVFDFLGSVVGQDGLECFLWVVPALLLAEGVFVKLKHEFHILSGSLHVVPIAEVLLSQFDQ